MKRASHLNLLVGFTGIVLLTLMFAACRGLGRVPCVFFHVERC